MTSSEVEQVQRHVESLLPDKDLRRICLSIFADSIAKLHAHGANLWGAYCTNRHIRLLGGSLIVLTLEHHGLWLTLDQTSFTASPKLARRVDALTTWRWDVSGYPAYLRVSSRNGYYLPSATHQQDWPLLRALHFVLLDRVAQKFAWLSTKSQKKHQSSLVTYLQRVLNRDIPAPYYEAPSHNRQPSTFLRLPEEMPEAQKLYEGSRVQIVVNAHERNPVARQMCIDHFGAHCVVCGFDFAEKYGDIAAGIIQVHHLTRLADIGEAYEVDPIEDLRPVCPNCHVVLHQKNPPFTIEEVQGFISRRSRRQSCRGSLRGCVNDEGGVPSW